MNFHKILLIAAFITTGMAVFTQDEPSGIDGYYYYNQRIPGDFSLSINLGSNLGLFFQDLDGELSETNLTPGLLGALDLEWYLNNNWKIGTGVRGLIAWGPNDYPLYMAPILLKTTWEFKWPPTNLDLFGEEFRLAFSMPVHFGAGVNFTTYEDRQNMEPILTAGTSFLVHPGSSFGYGLLANYWFVPQLYDGVTVPESHGRLGHFLELSLSIVYTP